ncbi:MAG: hypothetical protein PHE43_03190 [Candidatus Nanoarchaeia archaeon]|nr:hypothetical protein [Candidatus Nanoarchaeia archaeon]
MLNKVKDKKLFSEGKRSFFYTGKLNNTKVGIKKLKERKDIRHALKNEANFLKILNKHKIGPRLIYSKNNYIIYHFVEGIPIEEFIKKNNKQKIKSIIIKILNQCFVLDKLKINKLEMTNPYKHILIKTNPVMIDFERCYHTEKPKNLTQFLQYLTSYRLSLILKQKNIKINKKEIIKLAKQYKKGYSDFNKIKKYISKV